MLLHEDVGGPVNVKSEDHCVFGFRRVVATLVGRYTLVPTRPCRGGKRQEQQCGEDAFHALIGLLAGGGADRRPRKNGPGGPGFQALKKTGVP